MHLLNVEPTLERSVARDDDSNDKDGLIVIISVFVKLQI